MFPPSLLSSVVIALRIFLVCSDLVPCALGRPRASPRRSGGRLLRCSPRSSPFFAAIVRLAGSPLFAFTGLVFRRPGGPDAYLYPCVIAVPGALSPLRVVIKAPAMEGLLLGYEHYGTPVSLFFDSFSRFSALTFDPVRTVLLPPSWTPSCGDPRL